MPTNNVSILVGVDASGAKTSFDNLEKSVSTQTGNIASSFDRLGDRIKRRFERKDIKTLGSSIEGSLMALATGGSIEDVLGAAGLSIGISMATQMIVGLATTIAGSAAVQALIGALAPITAGLEAAATTLGSLLSSAIAIGMAAFPVVLAGIIIAAIAFLIANPDIAKKILDFAGGVVDFIIKGIAALPGLLFDAISAAVQWVVDNIGPFVQKIVDFFLGIPGQLVELGGAIVSTIVGGLASLPGKIWDIVTQAFRDIKIDIGPFHIRGTGITIDLPKIDASASQAYHAHPQGHAAGGWVGLHGPEMAIVGERGPEYIVPNHQLGGMGGGGFTIQGVSEREIVEMVDRGLYFKLRRAAPAGGVV